MNSYTIQTGTTMIDSNGTVSVMWSTYGTAKSEQAIDTMVSKAKAWTGSDKVRILDAQGRDLRDL